MSRERRRKTVDRKHPALSTVRQCSLLGISRSSVYYRSRGHSQKDLAVMKLIDQQYPSATLSTGSKYTFLWVSAHGGLAGQARSLGKPETGPASDADHGTPGHLPAAPDQPAGTRAQGVSVSAGRHGDHQA